ncbi:T9SS type A sorting domain-containing protein, partial [Arthrospira platensis SPKY1]|nr:T9SS type A sorting domain-containing protein [Arthrospira platensis SPKY1]
GIALSVQGNPFQDRLMFTVSADGAERAQVSLHSLAGDPVVSQIHQLQAGENTLAIEHLSGMPTGSYLLRVSFLDSGRQATAKLVKQ